VTAPIPSQRATTSSRTPGRVNEGTVWLPPKGLRLCRECGGLCDDMVPLGQHAPHLSLIGEELHVVNCAGRVLR
jgi:hypothetical protein